MIVIIVLDPLGRYNCLISKFIQSKGYRVLLLSWRNFDSNFIYQLDASTDTIFFRTGALDSIPIARAFEKAGFKVINNWRYIQLSTQKHLANVYAKANGIRTADLNVAIKKSDVSLIWAYLKKYGSLVAKPIISRDMGRYVFLIENEHDLEKIQLIPGQHILLQNEVRFSRLIRTIVIGKKMLEDATTYDIKHDSWKATVCANPKVKPYYNTSNELKRIAESTLCAFGGEIGYIDYFETTNGFVFNEINHSCGLIEHERVTRIPIHREIGEHLIYIHNSFQKEIN